MSPHDARLPVGRGIVVAIVLSTIGAALLAALGSIGGGWGGAGDTWSGWSAAGGWGAPDGWGAPSAWGTAGAWPAWHALRLVVALLGLAYTAYLLAESGERVGRITAFVLWCIAALLIWLAAPTLVLYVLAHAGLVFVVRALYFSPNLIGALADLGLIAIGLVFAVWAASRSHSALLAFWCFFLVQSFHVRLLGQFGSRTRNTSRASASTDDAFSHAPGDDAFARAHAAAEDALRRMTAGQ